MKQLGWIVIVVAITFSVGLFQSSVYAQETGVETTAADTDTNSDTDTDPDAGADAGADAVGEIEEFEFTDFEVVEKPEQKWTLGKIVGRMHPAVIHMPIAWLVLLVLVDILNFVLGQKWLNKPGYWLLILTVCSFIPALLTGFINLNHKASVDELAIQHRNMAILAFALCIAALNWRVIKKNNLEGGVKYLYLLLILLAAALIGQTGHLGGKMVFGLEYLPF